MGRPSSRSRAPRSSDDVVTATAPAPPRAASWTAVIPMLPAAPRTSTVSPGAKWAFRRAKWATSPEPPSVTASAPVSLSGSARTSSTRATACPAYPPDSPVNAHTRRPVHAASTPSPRR